MTVHYQHDAIATFPVPPETVFRYMSAGNHQHAAFKSHRLVGVTGDLVTIEAEIYNPTERASRLRSSIGSTGPRGSRPR